jgi:hypothetical protein
VSSSTDLWTFKPDAALETDLSGFSVDARDGTIGEVASSASEAGAGYLVVHCGGRLFGHDTLVPAGAVEELDLDTETVFLTLTKAEVEAAPSLDRDRVDDESYRAALADYYLTRPALDGLVDDPTAYREG